METCGMCHGEGERMHDWGWSWCRNCGGSGYVDPYEQDEWYDEEDDEMTDEGWEDYLAWLEAVDATESTGVDQPLTPPSPTAGGDDEH